MRTLSLLFLPLAVGCGAASGATGTTLANQNREIVDMEEMRITARSGPDGLSTESYDAEVLFRRAATYLEDARCLDAVALYDQITQEFPSSRYASPALYNSGFCLREDGDHAGAVQRLERLQVGTHDATDIKHGSFLRAESYLVLERWDEGTSITDTILDDRTLSADERMEAMSYRARALLGAEDFESAARQATTALAFYRGRTEEDRIRAEQFAAASNFVLAETHRFRAEAVRIPVAAVETQQAILEQRASIMLDAQREYFNAITFRIPEWSAPAGYRIGTLYDGLWSAIMDSPLPPPTSPLPPGTEDVYEREYRLEMARLIEPLMRHAVRYWELTLGLIERTREGNEWFERLEADLERARARLDNPLVEIQRHEAIREEGQSLSAPLPG